MEYQVTVDQFTGPLDLLLHLIKEHDMDLLDLDVAAVCDQYLAGPFYKKYTIVVQNHFRCL